jgi:hypothetical protein
MGTVEERIAAAVASAVTEEREACARIAEGWSEFTGCRTGEDTSGLDPATRQYARGHYHARKAIADGIRARRIAGGTDRAGGAVDA